MNVGATNDVYVSSNAPNTGFSNYNKIIYLLNIEFMKIITLVNF